MTHSLPPGSPQSDPSLDDERPPMTRREARERERRAEALKTGEIGVPGDPVEVRPDPVEVRGGRHDAVGGQAASPSDVDGLFWGALGDDGSTERDAPAAASGADTPRERNAWASLDYPTEGKDARPKRQKKKRRWLTATIVTVVIVGLVGGGALYAWTAFQPQVQKLLALGEPTDYTGSGTTPVTISIHDGDTGSTIADTLAKAGVIKTSDAFYTLLLHTKPEPVFQPGVYQLKKQMSAKSALAALENPKNKLQRTLTIPEGDTQAQILPALAKTTGVPLADLQAAAKPADFGLPAQAKNLDGFLFPATYTFDPGVNAKTVIKTLVDRAFQALDDDGVPAAKRFQTVVLASIVQKEAGNDADMGKVSRVFTNRLAQGMHLQSDATVAYGAGVKTVFTTDAQRNDAGNPYNTYAHAGLPVGPISNPGDVAIKAVMNPTPGSWLYFVTVDLKTGQTVFSTTASEHDAAVQQLQQWCAASAANDAYCQ